MNQNFDGYPSILNAGHFQGRSLSAFAPGEFSDIKDWKASAGPQGQADELDRPPHRR